MLIERTIYNSIKKVLLGDRRVIVIYGPRQAGKTTLTKQLISILPADEVKLYQGDDLRVQEAFSQPILDKLATAIGGKKYLVIDEAQRIPNIGLVLKLIHDQLPVQIIVTGSASFDLANQLNEPLTGRTSTFYLYPLSLKELDKPLLKDSLEFYQTIMRFGCYPKLLNIVDETEKQNYLKELINNYLYQDILAFDQVRKPKKVVDLLTLLALQIGGEVSIRELSSNLSLAKPAVERYLDILEKMFIIFNLRGFSRNLRKEINKTSKYYFWDLGLRNALIQNFNQFSVRNDIGACFENMAIVERMKSLNNEGKTANFYFWRTYDQKEIDLIEEREGKITAFEFKWKTDRVKPPSEFLATYPNSDFRLITGDNLNGLVI